jgi:hypothetical protein
LWQLLQYFSAKGLIFSGNKSAPAAQRVIVLSATSERKNLTISVSGKRLTERVGGGGSRRDACAGTD